MCTIVAGEARRPTLDGSNTYKVMDGEGKYKGMSLISPKGEDDFLSVKAVEEITTGKNYIAQYC